MSEPPTSSATATSASSGAVAIGSRYRGVSEPATTTPNDTATTVTRGSAAATSTVREVRTRQAHTVPPTDSSSRRNVSPFSRRSPPFSVNQSTVSASRTSLHR